MTFDVLALLLAAGGGFFAAAIGALHAFIFTGFMVLAGQAIAHGRASGDFLSFVAFGPLFGPHIAFAGGVAAVAYAARTDKEVGGKDIGVPLISIERPDVLLVGAGVRHDRLHRAVRDLQDPGLRHRSSTASPLR